MCVCVSLFTTLIYYCLHVCRRDIASESPISLRYVKTYGESSGWFGTGNCLEQIVHNLDYFDVHVFYIGHAPIAPARPFLGDVNLVKTLEEDLIISSSKLKLMEIIGRGGLGLSDPDGFSCCLFHQ